MVISTINSQTVPVSYNSSSFAGIKSVKEQNTGYNNDSKSNMLMSTLACLAAGSGGHYCCWKKRSFGRRGSKVFKGFQQTKNNLQNTIDKPNRSNYQKATSKLVELYDAVAKSAKTKGNTKREQVYSDFAQKAQKGEFSGQDLYGKLYTEYYNKLRRADYPVDSKFNSKIADYTEKSTANIQVRNENNWHYRIPSNRKQFGWSTADKCLDRISVNAVTDEKLIVAIDNLFATGKVKGYYKTPADSASWLERHDPITIYLHEPASPRILLEVENLTKPYIRSTEDVLCGHKFSPGLALEKSPQTQEIKDLIEKATKIDSEMGKALENQFSSNGTYKASAGQMSAANMLVGLFN